MRRRRSVDESRYARFGVAALIVGVALIAIALIPWHSIFGANSGTAGAAANSGGSGTSTDEFDNKSPSSASPNVTRRENPLNQAGHGDVFAAPPTNEYPFGNPDIDAAIHEIVIETTSDGALYIGYRFRDGTGEGLRVVDTPTTITRRVRGPLPVAQLGLQVLGTATYGTCTIYIDGIKVVSRTANGRWHVTVCTA